MTEPQTHPYQNSAYSQPFYPGSYSMCLPYIQSGNELLKETVSHNTWHLEVKKKKHVGYSLAHWTYFVAAISRVDYISSKDVGTLNIKVTLLKIKADCNTQSNCPQENLVVRQLRKRANRLLQQRAWRNSRGTHGVLTNIEYLWYTSMLFAIGRLLYDIF